MLELVEASDLAATELDGWAGLCAKRDLLASLAEQKELRPRAVDPSTTGNS